MNQKQVNSALDKALESEFDDSPMPMNYPMVVPEKIEVPATISEEQKHIKTNLYNTSEKLSAVLDYLVGNIEELSTSNSLIKTSPVADIVSVAHEIGLINDRIYKYTQPQQANNQHPNNSKITQNNINFNGLKGNEKETKEFSLETLDNMIKNGEIK